MTITQRQGAWVQAHGTAAQADRASWYLRYPGKTTDAAMAVLFRRVCEGRP